MNACSPPSRISQTVERIALLVERLRRAVVDRVRQFRARDAKGPDAPVDLELILDRLPELLDALAFLDRRIDQALQLVFRGSNREGSVFERLVPESVLHDEREDVLRRCVASGHQPLVDSLPESRTPIHRFPGRQEGIRCSACRRTS